MYTLVDDVHLSRDRPNRPMRKGGVRMAKQIDAGARPRIPLSRDRVLSAAVTLADQDGIESLSMRKLAQEFGVVPMALYKHVANKHAMPDGMVDVVFGEIALPPRGTDGKR